MASSSTEISPASFNDYNDQLQVAALKATRNAVSLPADMGFHRSMDRSLATELDACSSRVLNLTNKLLNLASATGSASQQGKGKGRLQSEEDVLDSFHSLVVDTMDQLLERADICIDDFLGRSKPPVIAVNPVLPAPQNKKAIVAQGRLDPVLQHASYLPKPQLLFKRKPDNSRDTVWRPLLRHKYNAQVPLGYNFQEEGDDDSSSSLHPYRYEIKHLDYPANMFRSSPPIQPKSFDDTPLTWVATPADLSVMLEKLRSSKEIAVDLEYHSYRSFGGFVCLMQISSREEDFIVDTLAVREELEELNEVFTDPKIVKVFHGAESDIVWLQQNFNLYIVNLFDTYHASKVLDFPRHGLAALLEMYCDFTPDKRYQLADWRIRPLPQEMLTYARSDTHFLLFIYDNLRNALLDTAQSRAQSPSGSSTPPGPVSHDSLVREVLARSAETALREYQNETYDEEGGSGSGGWDTLARKWNKGALMAGERGGMPREVYRCVHGWRDRVAREEDESTRYVLPNHYLFKLAETPPADMAALLRVFQPVPPVIRRRGKELLDAIRDVVRQQLESAVPASAIKPTVEPVSSVTAMQVDDDMLSTSVSKLDVSSTKLWSNVSRPSIAAISSALFGPSSVTSVSNIGAISCAAPQSVLFGPAEIRLNSHSMNSARFRDVVARIHETLVIAPSVPVPIATEAEPQTQSSASEESGHLDASSGQTEIPFIPAGQRQGASREIVDDSIVVVGQARQKKRKRAKASVNEDSAGASDRKHKNLGGSDDVLEFDYSKASNILDEGSDHEDEGQRRKRKEKKHGTGYQYGNFPAPPKAHSQLKSGNVSHTFR